MNTTKMASDWLYREDWSFKNSPPESDILTYGKALLICANGDGKVADTERQWVLGYCAAKGIGADVLDKLKSYPATEDIGAVVKAAPAVNKSRRALVYDACRTASADGELHPAEWSAIVKMAGHLDISEGDALTIRRTYEEERSARDRRIATCFPEGTPF